ncbi:uricase [Coccidioides immitis RMSCC 3703]|uniref:factor independent urate hydroxylase n=1 Tax=Coccidioides immitis RMSCC 3703 TaxID=454286 RepID=A0A0J8QXF5_COCIT|nr:uricase [Coccidioides immitis RMSCC 3703]
METTLAAARYGKENVKVCKVHRDTTTGWQTVTEMTVSVLLEGDIESSYVSPVLAAQTKHLPRKQIHQSRQ